MKIRILYSLFLLSMASILFWNASGGPAAVQQEDRTGSPLGTATCTLCHNSSAFSPSLEVQLLDGETAVSTYEPGKTYTLSVMVTGAAAAAGYGFQAVLLSGDNDANAGSFGTAPAGIQVTPLNDRMYAEHSMRSSESTFTIDWTAPETGVGNIRIYASGNAVNGDGNLTGDQAVSLANPIILAQGGPSSTSDRLLSSETISITPNPTRSGVTITLDSRQPGLYNLTLYNAMGQRLQNQRLNLVLGKQSHWIDLSDQSNGLYFLQLSNGQQHLSRKILKQ